MNLKEELGLAKSLFGSPRSTAAVAGTAVAVASSADGKVEIQYDGDTETMVVDCVGSIASGDEVDVIIRDGGSTYVVGSKGWGDATDEAIEESSQRLGEAVDTLNELQSQFEGVQVDLTSLDEQLAQLGVWVKVTPAGLQLGKEDDPFSVLITNTAMYFYERNSEVAHITNQQLFISEARVTGKMQFGDFAFIPRESDGSMYLAWVGA